MMGAGMIGGMILFWIAFIVLVVLVSQGLFLWPRHQTGEQPPLSAREILKIRYARGEITQAQFQQILKDLE